MTNNLRLVLKKKITLILIKTINIDKKITLILIKTQNFWKESNPQHPHNIKIHKIVEFTCLFVFVFKIMSISFVEIR